MRKNADRRHAARARGGAAAGQSFQVLRYGGVYRLPDGGEFVVGAGGGGHYFLYHPLVWKGHRWIINMPVAYEVDHRRGICTGAGRPTGWTIEDLQDTCLTMERQTAGTTRRGQLLTGEGDGAAA